MATASDRELWADVLREADALQVDVHQALREWKMEPSEFRQLLALLRGTRAFLKPNPTGTTP